MTFEEGDFLLLLPLITKITTNVKTFLSQRAFTRRNNQLFTKETESKSKTNKRKGER